MAAGIEQAEAAGPKPYGVAGIEVTTDDHAEPRAGAAAGLLGQLQDHAVEDHRVVAADHTLVLLTEDLLEIHAAQRRLVQWPIA